MTPKPENRRAFLHRLVAGVGAVGLAACRPNDLEAWTARAHPEWLALLVTDAEPGERMTVTGRVLGPDGQTPRKGVSVHVYHTDAQGHYSKGGTDENQHRIQGTMRTNAEGRYEFRSIRPASYPGTTVTPHVHYVVSAPGQDPQRVTLRLRTAQKAPADLGPFDADQPLVKDAKGIWRCTFDLKLNR